jgi:hypothetical protein
MGAKTWMLVLSDGEPKSLLAARPPLDRAATTALATRLFPEKLTPLTDGILALTCPPDNELVIGVFPGLTIIAAKEFALDYPSRLPASFFASAPSRWVCLHGMHSVVDWFGYAIWRDGQLQRSLSVAPDEGIIEDIGERLPFEVPFWDGEHRVDDEDDDDAYPLDFHPLDLAEAALFDLFGYCIEGDAKDALDAEAVPLMRFGRGR